jgi:hypothetical protein
MGKDKRNAKVILERMKIIFPEKIKIHDDEDAILILMLT